MNNNKELKQQTDNNIYLNLERVHGGWYTRDINRAIEYIRHFVFPMQGLGVRASHTGEGWTLSDPVTMTDRYLFDRHAVVNGRTTWELLSRKEIAEQLVKIKKIAVNCRGSDIIDYQKNLERTRLFHVQYEKELAKKKGKME